MIRLLPLLAVVACVAPGGTGGGPSGSPTTPAGTNQTGIGTGGTTAPTSGPTVPYLAPDADDGTLAAVAPVTRLISPAETIHPPFAGDFDGNGIADLAFGYGVDTVVWFGPLPAGDLAALGGQVQIVGTRAGGVADVEGDGRDELGLGEHLIAVPSSGVLTDLDLAAHSILRVQGAAPGPGRILDLDGDGSRDLVVPDGDELLWVVYGPLGPEHSVISEAADAGSALMRGAKYDCHFAVVVLDLGDVTGDARPEVGVLEGVGLHMIGDDDCSDPDVPNLILAGADYRRQSLVLADAVQSGLAYDLVPFGDLDGDGRAEMKNGKGIFTAPALFAGGGAAEPLVWPGPNVTFEIFRPGVFLDLSGDGRVEIPFHAGVEARVTDGATSLGELTEDLGQPSDPLLEGFQLVADVTGDGVTDGVYWATNVLRVYSGATLSERWVP